MALTGLFILFFVVTHVRMFKFGPWYVDPATGHRDLYRLVAEIYQNPLYVGFYVVAMGADRHAPQSRHLERGAVARALEPAVRARPGARRAACWRC